MMPELRSFCFLLFIGFLLGILRYSINEKRYSPIGVLLIHIFAFPMGMLVMPLSDIITVIKDTWALIFLIDAVQYTAHLLYNQKEQDKELS
jgi:hypothetical protein